MAASTRPGSSSEATPTTWTAVALRRRRSRSAPSPTTISATLAGSGTAGDRGRDGPRGRARRTRVREDSEGTERAVAALDREQRVGAGRIGGRHQRQERDGIEQEQRERIGQRAGLRRRHRHVDVEAQRVRRRDRKQDLVEELRIDERQDPRRCAGPAGECRGAERAVGAQARDRDRVRRIAAIDEIERDNEPVDGSAGVAMAT